MINQVVTEIALKTVRLDEQIKGLNKQLESKDQEIATLKKLVATQEETIKLLKDKIDAAYYG